jgi:radical SAM protein with 4Fe4S-binding SPASM domain
MNPIFGIGNVNDGIASDLPQRIAAFDARGPYTDKCNDCSAVNSCNGVCMFVAAVENSDLFTMTRKLWPVCEFNRLYWSEAMRAHAILNRKDSRNYFRWYGRKCR